MERKLVGHKIIYVLLANKIGHICWGSPSYQREGARSSFYCKDHHLRRHIPHRASVHLLTTHDEDVVPYRPWNDNRFDSTHSPNCVCATSKYIWEHLRKKSLWSNRFLFIYKTQSSLLSMCLLWVDTVSDRSKTVRTHTWKQCSLYKSQITHKFA